MELLTAREMAEIWKISARRVALLCNEGRIKGAMKKGKTWLIPSDANKPKDGRVKGDSIVDKYMELEKRFKVIYPESKNATYTSLLNYSDDLDKPFQRWYRYKEGFSIELVKKLIKEYSKNKSGIILDPFSGSGSTLLAASYLGYSGMGYEVNPFSYFLSKCKLQKYSDKNVEDFKKKYEEILEKATDENIVYNLPKLSISNKVFNQEVEGYFMRVGTLINDGNNIDAKVKDLLKLGWLACLEFISNYRKAGNGLKKKKYVNPKPITSSDAKVALLEEYQKIHIDLLKDQSENNTEKLCLSVRNETCMNMKSQLIDASIEGIVFSPPYANCFDYTEIYKLELWFGKFVKEYTDLKNLRKTSIHSHLNGDLNEEICPNNELLKKLISELQSKSLWDKKIPKMLNMYYNDMFKILDECYRVLTNKGFCCIVVGNSSYGGIVFPADLILAEYAKSIGFTVDKIEVDRYIITSSQQYELTKDMGKFLRESVICLVKN